MSVESIKAQLAQHQEQRPDHLAAIRAGLSGPNNPVYLAWVAWVARKTMLEAELTLAEQEEQCQWVVTPSRGLFVGDYTPSRHTRHKSVEDIVAGLQDRRARIEAMPHGEERAREAQAYYQSVADYKKRLARRGEALPALPRIS
jgi:hypothetical protein